MNTASAISKTQNGLRGHAILMLGMLVIQYALGMWTNLFVQFPDTNQGGPWWEFLRSQPPAAAHVWIALLLFVSAVILVIRAVSKNDGRWIVSSAVGLIAITAAIYGGVAYSASQNDAYSLVMALSFIIAFLAYGSGLAAARG